jgi:actin-like ATPase involved in cell morphogenesis
MEGGGRKVTVSVIVGGESADNKIIDYQAKEFEASQTTAEQAEATRKAVVLSIDYEVPANAVRIRVVTRDAASGRLGSFELPVTRIHGVAGTRPAVPSEPKTPSL